MPECPHDALDTVQQGFAQCDPASAVVCSGTDRNPGGTKGLVLPRVAGWVGLDIDPVRLDDLERVRWLEACLWPDVPGRVERFRAAVALARADPPEVIRADLVDDLEAVADRARDAAGAGVHLVVLSSGALTYVERRRRAEVLRQLAALASGGAVSWVSAEPPGCVPGMPVPAGMERGGSGTVLGLHRWGERGALRPTLLGTCHPHGEWVDLRPPRSWVRG